MLRAAVKSFLLLENADRAKYLGVVVARVLIQGLDAIGLILIGVIAMLFTGTFESSQLSSFVGLNGALGTNINVLWLGLATVAFFVTKSILGIGLLRVTVLFLAGMESRASLELARYFYTRDLQTIRSSSKGEIQRLLDQSTREAFFFILFSAATVVTELSLFLVVLVTFLYVDPPGTLGLLVFLIFLVGLFQLLVTKRLRRLGSRTARLTAKTNDSVLDLVSSFREAAVLEKQGWFLNRFELSRGRLSRNRAMERFTMSTPRYMVEAGLILGAGALLLWKVGIDGDPAGFASVAVFLAGGARMIAALVPMQNGLNELNYYAGQAEKSQELLHAVRKNSCSDDSAVRLNEPSGFSQGADRPAGISLRRVSYSFPGSSTLAIDDLSLDVLPGEFVALIGPSGAGKSTLVDLILGIQEPSSGKIAVGGLPSTIFRSEFPGSVSYCPQSPAFFSGTLAQNVAIGMEEEEIDYSRVQEVLEQVGLGPKVGTLRRGLRTKVGEQFDFLSGGELQRLGIARALYSRPELIVLDEATSALDAESESLVATLVQELKGRVTVIMIAHRLSTVQHADRLFLIEGGTIVASGALSSLMRSNKRVARYVELMNISEPN